jgi:hypothetical protein
MCSDVEQCNLYFDCFAKTSQESSRLADSVKSVFNRKSLELEDDTTVTCLPSTFTTSNFEVLGLSPSAVYLPASYSSFDDPLERFAYFSETTNPGTSNAKVPHNSVFNINGLTRKFKFTIYYGNEWASGGTTYIWGKNGINSGGYLFASSGSNPIFLWLAKRAGSASNYALQYFNRPNPNRWNDIEITIVNSVMTAASVNGVPQVVVNNTPANGTYGDNTLSPFTINGSSLTNAEAQASRNVYFADFQIRGEEDEVLLQYKFDEDLPTTLLDSVGGVNGVYSNALLFDNTQKNLWIKEGSVPAYVPSGSQTGYLSSGIAYTYSIPTSSYRWLASSDQSIFDTNLTTDNTPLTGWTNSSVTQQTSTVVVCTTAINSQIDLLGLQFTNFERSFDTLDNVWKTRVNFSATVQSTK